MPSIFTKIKKKFGKSGKEKVSKSAEIVITKQPKQPKQPSKAKQKEKKGLFFKSSSKSNKKVTNTKAVKVGRIEEKENRNSSNVNVNVTINTINTTSQTCQTLQENRSKSPNSTSSPPLFEGFMDDNVTANGGTDWNTNHRIDQRQLGSLMDLDSSFDEDSSTNQTNHLEVVKHQHQHQHQPYQQSFQPYRNYTLDNNNSNNLNTNEPNALGLPSPTESSDFCLSTDVEDDEYNKIRHNGHNALPEVPLTPSDDSTQSSEAYGLFPNLIDNKTQSNTLTDNHNPNANNMRITPMAHETEDDLRAWTPSPRHNTAPAPNLFSFDQHQNQHQHQYPKKQLSSDTLLQQHHQLSMNNNKPNIITSIDSSDAENNSYVAPLVGESLLATSMESNDSLEENKLMYPPAFNGVSLADGLSPASTERESLCSPNNASILTSTSKQSQTQTQTQTQTTNFFDPSWSTQSDFKFSSHASFSPKKESISTQIPQHPRSINNTTTQTAMHNTMHTTMHRPTNSAPVILTPATSNAKEKIKRKKRRKDSRAHTNSDDYDDDHSNEVCVNVNNENDWLIDEVTGALGPRGITADLESLGGRSQRSNKSKTSTGGKSHRSTRSHRSTKSHKSTNSRRSRRSHRHHHHSQQHPSGESVGSKNSHISHRSSRSTRSHLSHMSEASRSVANDLLRLEMQLAMVGSTDKTNVNVNPNNTNNSISGNSRGSLLGSYSGAHSVGNTSRSSRKTSQNNSHQQHASRRSKITIIAPPGKLGIILANKFDTKGTVISGVRSSSVLVDKLHPGDRITAVDGEDVSRMTVAEITTIMARKNDFERTLTVLTTPKTISSPTNNLQLNDVQSSSSNKVPVYVRN